MSENNIVINCTKDNAKKQTNKTNNNTEQVETNLVINVSKQNKQQNSSSQKSDLKDVTDDLVINFANKEQEESQSAPKRVIHQSKDLYINAPENNIVTDFEFENAPTLLQTGSTYKLRLKFTPSQALYDKIIWRTSDSKIIDIDEYGRLTPLKEGTATITCKINDIIRTCTIRVTVPIRKGFTYRFGWFFLS